MQGTAVNPERNNTAGGEAEGLFSLALEARCEFAMMWLYASSGDTGTQAFDRHREAANGWRALDLPFPEKILETLRAAKPVHVDGYGLYSEEDSICSVSPYGIERVMCGVRDRTLTVIEGFVADMALAAEWEAVLH